MFGVLYNSQLFKQYWWPVKIFYMNISSKLSLLTA